MTPLAASVLLGAAAGAANVAGGALLVWRRPTVQVLQQLIALGAGFLLSTTLLEMIPHALAEAPARAALLTLMGYVAVHLLERAVVPHAHLSSDMPTATGNVSVHTTYSVLFGLAVHTFFDGVAISSGFILSTWLGWLIFFAVLLHKVPEGLTVASFMLSAREGRSAALASTVLLARTTVAGTLVMGRFPHLVGYGLPAAAGVSLYVAASGLIPEINRHSGRKSTVAFLVGIGLFLSLRALSGL